LSGATALFILITAFFTAILTGVFGLAGGLVLMGALALVLPVQAAFVTHGFIQIIANGWRAILHRKHIRWLIVGLYAAGSVLAGIVVALISVVPSKPVLYLLLGLVSFIVWLPKDVLRLDAQRPPHAFAAGLSVTGLNLAAGVAGPMLDIFFVKTGLTRHQIVATKAGTQVFSHLAKILVYGVPLLKLGAPGMPPAWLFAAAAPLSIIGTVIGGRLLDRLTDLSFIAWTRKIITAIGVAYLARAAQLWWS